MNHGWNIIWRVLGGCTEIKRWVLLAGVVVNVGDAKRLDGNGTNSEQELAQQQQGVRYVLGGVVLLAAALIGRFGVEVVLRLADGRSVVDGGCWATQKHVLGQRPEFYSMKTTGKPGLMVGCCTTPSLTPLKYPSEVLFLCVFSHDWCGRCIRTVHSGSAARSWAGRRGRPAGRRLRWTAGGGLDSRRNSQRWWGQCFPPGRETTAWGSRPRPSGARKIAELRRQPHWKRPASPTSGWRGRSVSRWWRWSSSCSRTPAAVPAAANCDTTRRTAEKEDQRRVRETEAAMATRVHQWDCRKEMCCFEFREQCQDGLQEDHPAQTSNQLRAAFLPSNTYVQLL